MAQVRSDFVEGMKKQGYRYFYEERDTLPEVAPAVFREETLDAAWTQWTMVVESGEPEEKTSEYADAPVSDTIEGFTVYMKARSFHKAARWSKETIRDHQKIENLVSQTVKNWARGSHSKREKFYAGFFNHGGLTAGRDDTFDNSLTGNVTDPSGDGIYDGTAASVSPFFSLSGGAVRHTNKVSTTYHNAITGALNEGNLEAALILLEPPGSPVDAHEGVINPYQNRLRPIVWKFLTDTDAWFVGIAKRGVVMGKRQEPEMNMFIDQRNGAFEAVYDERYGGTVEDYRPWVASNTSTS